MCIYHLPHGAESEWVRPGSPGLLPPILCHWGRRPLCCEAGTRAAGAQGSLGLSDGLSCPDCTDRMVGVLCF